jgi:hypothetical protein
MHVPVKELGDSERGEYGKLVAGRIDERGNMEYY